MCVGFDGSTFVFSGIPNKTYNILSTEVWCAAFNALLEAAAAWCSVLLCTGLCRGLLVQHVHASKLPARCQIACPEPFSFQVPLPRWQVPSAQPPKAA